MCAPGELWRGHQADALTRLRYPTLQPGYLARALTRGEPGCVRAQAEFGEEAFAAQRARAEADRRAAKEAAVAGAADANATPLGQRVHPV